MAERLSKLQKYILTSLYKYELRQLECYKVEDPGNWEELKETYGAMSEKMVGQRRLARPWFLIGYWGFKHTFKGVELDENGLPVKNFAGSFAPTDREILYPWQYMQASDPSYRRRLQKAQVTLTRTLRALAKGGYLLLNNRWGDPVDIYDPGLADAVGRPVAKKRSERENRLVWAGVSGKKTTEYKEYQGEQIYRNVASVCLTRGGWLKARELLNVNSDDEFSELTFGEDMTEAKREELDKKFTEFVALSTARVRSILGKEA